MKRFVVFLAAGAALICSERVYFVVRSFEHPIHIEWRYQGTSRNAGQESLTVGLQGLKGEPAPKNEHSDVSTVLRMNHDKSILEWHPWVLALPSEQRDEVQRMVATRLVEALLKAEIDKGRVATRIRQLTIDTKDWVASDGVRP